MEWSRRQILAALGAGALAPVLPSCRSSAPRLAPRAVARDLNGELAELVGRLAAAHDDARAELIVRHRGSAGHDGEGGLVERWIEPTLWLGVRRGERWIEHATDDLGRAGLDRAAQILGGVGPRSRAVASARPDGAALPGDPRRASDAAWHAPALAAWRRAGALGGSRVVHRLASLEVDDRDVVFLSPAGSLAERRITTRMELRFVAFGRAGLVTETATRAARGGLERARLSDRALAAAAERALATFTAQAMAGGETALVLGADVAAALIGRALGPALGGPGPLVGRAIASPMVTVVDDPTAPDALGGYGFDSEGTRPRRVELVAAGVVHQPVTDQASAARLGIAPSGHGQRGPDGRVAPRLGRLIVTPGPASADEVVAVAERGFLLDGPLMGRGGPGSGRLALIVGRAREIEAGQLTGRLFGPVALRGDLAAMLGAVRAVGRDATTIELDGSFVSSPALVTRGRLDEVRPWR